MTEFLLRSITKGKFEEWHPESFSSLEAVCEQVEDFRGDEEFVECFEMDRATLEKGIIPLFDRTNDVRDILSDREREREENNKERFEITASGRTRKL